MKRGRVNITLICSMAAFIVAGFTSTFAQIQTAREFSGRGTGIISVITPTTGSPSNVVTGDTCPLPARGGTSTATTSGPLISGILGTGTVVSTGSGSGLTSQSSSSVTDFFFRGGGWTVRAQNVTTRTQCNCCDIAAPGCSGETTITGLTITDPAGANFPVTVSGAANQTITLPGGAGTIVLNERITGPAIITVNGIHINITSGGTNYNIIAASSRSDIACTTGAGTTPAEVTVSGRVLDPAGNGLSRATVTLSGTQGAARTVTTGPYGDYSFSGVTAGQTYVLQVVHRTYTFQARVIDVLDEMTGVDFRADAARAGLK